MYWHSRHLCCILGGPLAKVGSSAKLCVLVFKASMLYLWGVDQPKEVHLPSTSLASRWGVHQQKKVHLLGGGPSAEGLSAKFELTSKFTLASQRSFCITYERPIS